MGAPPLHCYACAGQVRVDFNENWGGVEPKQCCNVMVETTNLHRLHPTFILYVYKVF